MNQAGVMRFALEAVADIAGRVEIDGVKARIFHPGQLRETGVTGFLIWVRHLTPVNGNLRGEIVAQAEGGEGEYLTRAPLYFSLEIGLVPVGTDYPLLADATGSLLRELNDYDGLSLGDSAWLGADKTVVPVIQAPDDAFLAEARGMSCDGAGFAVRIMFELGINSALRRDVKRVAERKIGMERLPKPVRPGA